METFSVWGAATARVVVALFYLVTALGLAKDFKLVTGLMAAKGVPAPGPLLIVTILVWLAGSGALILGRGIVPAALVLLVLTAIITPLIHNFWAVPAQERANEVQHFANNIAIMAGLLAIAAAASARPL